MEFGVQNVNANLFSDNKCIETENAWFWEMLNLVRIWHENALLSASDNAVMWGLQWDMSWVSMWHLEEDLCEDWSNPKFGDHVLVVFVGNDWVILEVSKCLQSGTQFQTPRSEMWSLFHVAFQYPSPSMQCWLLHCFTTIWMTLSLGFSLELHWFTRGISVSQIWQDWSKIWPQNSVETQLLVL